MSIDHDITFWQIPMSFLGLPGVYHKCFTITLEGLISDLVQTSELMYFIQNITFPLQ